MNGYAEFLESKAQLGTLDGFDPGALPAFLFDFQTSLVEWALRKGKAGIFADCGLGKTPMELAWADAIVRRENKPVLVLTPLAVVPQIIAEGEKFGIEVHRERKGVGIVATNYERLHQHDPNDYAGVACDESSILKNFDGVYRSEITEFMRKLKYRSLWTATAAPNDYIELGTSSEALGELGYMDMLNRFFKNDQNTGAHGGAGRTRFGGPYSGQAKWRFKGHAQEPFWRWVCSWARALRRPSDLGSFSDARFILPTLTEREHIVSATELAEGQLFALPAVGMREERDEMRRTVRERCEKVGELTAHDRPALVWCHRNDEGDLLESLVNGAVQVSGADSDEAKEEKLMAFVRGEARVLVSKPKVAGFGLNFQHCAHVTVFPSHSFEQYYQSVRRCWRFGQTRPVTVDIVTTEGGKGVRDNMIRKTKQADEMFSRLVAYMNDAMGLARSTDFHTTPTLPSWLSLTS